MQEVKGREESGPENEGKRKSEADIATHHPSRSGAWLYTIKSCLGARLSSAGSGSSGSATWRSTVHSTSETPPLELNSLQH